MSDLSKATIRALLVDDHAVFRESVVRALAAEPGFEIRECARITQALRMIDEAPVDVVLLDHDLGNERASQFLPAATQVGYAGRVLIVTAWISANEARRLFRQGVAGIFSKERSLGELAEAIRAVAAGGTWIDDRYSSPEDDRPGPQAEGPQFNELQSKVLRFVMEGLANKEIAWRLRISETYVKRILQDLFQKTGVRTRGQLVRVALEHYSDRF
jgi:two-component system, NarL family, nitrate/nitrite response regulator NarL